MAPLTWRNVDAPDFGRAADFLRLASDNWSGAFQNLSDTFNTAADNQANRASAPAFMDMARIASEGDVAGALDRIANIPAHLRTPELNAAMQELYTRGLNMDARRTQTGIASARNNRAQVTHDRGIAREDALAGLTSELVRRRENAQIAGATSNSALPASLVRTESGGNFQAQNNVAGSGGTGHFGRGQFSRGRLQDAKNAGVIPADMTPEAFMLSPEAQQRVEAWHVNDITSHIRNKGYDRLVGSTINGQPVTMDGLLAVAHLGGKGGLDKFVSSGGSYNPSDAFGTSLTNYLGTHQGNSIADLIPEGSPILPGDILPIIDRNFEAFSNAATAADNNRSRDYEFDQAVLSNNNAQAATSLAMNAVNNTANPVEAAQWINNSDMPDAVKVAALDNLRSLPAEELQSLPFGQGVGDADTIAVGTNLSTYAADQQAALANNNTVRIIQNAETNYANGDAPLKLVERLGLSDDEAGQALQKLNQVAQELKVSPAVAASLLEETASRVGWNPLDGRWRNETRLNADNAIALGREVYKPEDVRNATEMRLQGERQLAAAANLIERIGEYDNRIALADSRGQDSQAEELRAARARLITQGQDFFKNNPIVGRTPSRNGGDTPSPVSSAAAPSSLPNGSPVDRVSQALTAAAGNPDINNDLVAGASEIVQKVATTGRITAEDKAQAETLARDLIKEMTQVDGEAAKRVERMAAGDLLRVLSQIEQNIGGIGGADVEAQFQMLQSVKTALSLTNQ